MVVLASSVEHVIGIDPDRDRVTASVVDTATTGEQATAVFETTRKGYERLLKWADRHTQTAGRVWSVEGTGSYGAGLASYLTSRGEWVTEFNNPTPTADGAKTDTLRRCRPPNTRPPLAFQHHGPGRVSRSRYELLGNSPERVAP